jgi:serine/threonine protein kinase
VIAAPDLDSFELLGPLGSGGSAEVFRARSRTSPWTGALKVWRQPLTEYQRDKFLAECRLQWSLSDHPHIVRLYWAEAPEGKPPWLATELYERSLADVLRSGARPGVHEAWTLAEDILAGLAAMHAEGHVHRDVKPANVLLKEGRAALADLGIAMRVDAHTSDPAAGTAAYTAPELAEGAQPGYRSDVYSAAVTIAQIFPRPWPPVLAELLTRAMSLNSPTRPADAGVFLDELRAARTRSRRHRSRIVPPAASVLIAAAVAVGAASTTEAPPDPPTVRCSSEAVLHRDCAYTHGLQTVVVSVSLTGDRNQARATVSGLPTGTGPTVWLDRCDGRGRDCRRLAATALGSGQDASWTPWADTAGGHVYRACANWETPAGWRETARCSPFVVVPSTVDAIAGR